MCQCCILHGVMDHTKARFLVTGLPRFPGRLLWVAAASLLIRLLQHQPGVMGSPRNSATSIPEHSFRNSDCRLLINEINIFTEDSTKQFIELSRYCESDYRWSKGAQLKGYKLVFVAPDGYLLGVCSLDGKLKEREHVYYISHGNKRLKQIRKYWMYTIGTGYPDVDFERERCDLLRIGDRTQPARFPLGSTYPVGLALIYNVDPTVLRSISLMKNGDHFIRTKIDSKMEKIMLKYLQDFYVYGSRTKYQYCDYFSKFYKYQAEIGVILRDWFLPDQEDFSLSRCSSKDIRERTMPFQPKHFHYTTLTPGQPNDCKSSFGFRVEDFLERRNVPDEIFLSDYTLPCYALTDDPANTMGVITSDINFRLLFSQAVSDRNENNVEVTGPAQQDTNDGTNVCRTETVYVNANDEFEDLVGSHDAAEEPRFVVVDQTTFENGLENDKPHVWLEETCERFSQDNRDVIKKIPGQPLNIKDIINPNVCFWFSYLPNSQMYVCKLCQKLLLQQILFERPKSLQISNIMREGTMNFHFKNKWSNNRNIIQNHADSIYHQIALQWFKLYDSGLRGTELQKAFEDGPGLFADYISSTRSIMAITKQSVEMGLTFYNFSKLTDLIKYFGVDIGHLYGNGNGVRSLIDSISLVLHRDLVAMLLEKRPKLSILIDGTSDVSSDSVIAVLFMYETADGGTTISLYKILHMKEGESGDEIFAAFKSALEIDGLEEYFIEKIVSITSDGGGNIYNTFNAKLNNFVGRKVLRHWCNSHRENLLYVNTVKLYPNLKRVSKVVNNVHKMYNSRAPKKKTLLRAVTVEMGGKPFEVKRSHLIRWISGNLRSFKTLLTKWKYVVAATERIASSRNDEFKQETRAVARSLLKDLKDATFLSHLAFLCDIGSLLEKLSLVSQIKGATLISKKDLREQFLLLMKSLNAIPTETTEMLIKGSRTQGENSEEREQITSLQEFEEKHVSYEGVALNSPSPDDDGFYLYQNQQTYIAKFIELTNHYFEPDARDLFDIFEAKKFPANYDDSNQYGVQEITKMNTELSWGFDLDDLLQAWKRLLTQLTTHADFITYKNKQPEEFWKHFMDPSMQVGFEEITRNMMNNVLLVSASNAETERVLGIYGRTKTKQRYSLYPTTVESILRIRINTDQNLKTFNTMKHAKSFVLSGHSRANDMSRRAKLIGKGDWDELIPENENNDDNEADECEMQNDTDPENAVDEV